MFITYKGVFMLFNKQYSVNDFYFANVQYGSAGCCVLVVKYKSGYYDLFNREHVFSVQVSEKAPLTNYAKIEETEITKSQARKLGKQYIDAYREVWFNGVYEKSKSAKEPDEVILPISIS